MAQFINLLNERNSTESILLYFIVVGIAVIFAFLSQYDMVDKIGSIYRANVCLKRQKVLQSYIQRICLGISFLVLWFISAFADCGTDREAYGIIFTNVKLTDLTSGWQEPGFIIFNMIFRIFGDNPRIIYVAISTVTLYLFYRTWYKLRKDIMIGYGVLAFSTLFYVQSLSLMRIYLASAIVFCGIEYLRNRQYKNYLLFIILAGLIHYSAFILFLPLVLIGYMSNEKYKRYVYNIVVVTVLAAGIFFLALCSPLLEVIPIFSRFQRYLQDISFSSIGIMQFIYNIPICILVFLTYKEQNSQDQKISVGYTGSVFFLANLSYGIEILGRALSLFSVLYMFVIPLCIKTLKTYLWRGALKNKVIYLLINIVCIFYFLVRFSIYLGEYSSLDAIIPYKNILF